VRYNATLAAIGGGSLATGGLGMAGGTAILGAAVAAPVLAIAGWAYANHGENALDNAKKARQEVNEIIEKLKSGQEMLKQTEKYASKILDQLHDLFDEFNKYFDVLKKVNKLLVENSSEIRNLETKITTNVENGYALASILTDVITTPIFKIKMEINDQVLCVDENGIAMNDHVVCMEKDNNGFSILNKVSIDNAIKNSRNDLSSLAA
jgi:hypothetical protein